MHKGQAWVIVDRARAGSRYQIGGKSFLYVCVRGELRKQAFTGFVHSELGDAMPTNRKNLGSSRKDNG